MPLDKSPSKGGNGAALRIATLETQVAELRLQVGCWRRVAHALAESGLQAARLYERERLRALARMAERNKDGGNGG